ncbi:glycine betaine ABC transporter substrate-binding protein [Rubrivivax rivuli]|uniref:ABC transporter permease subunit n=1 Tax=Rubrivivax rivuli TaxID=1862385 RepID=A0A437RM04_9BURK|nr:glycine betaine ABC transporter substrate-binding protein [Rubrivivax rivuli]RVU47642.1 ABC transporter permease subunit [Rubrivivax rivuli]
MPAVLPAVLRAACFALVGLALALRALPAAAAEPIQVGSKRFTESYVLGELARLALQQGGVAAVHRQGLGNTAILEQALRSGQIDLYPEYTGTIVRELLKRQPAPGAPPPTLAELNTWLAPLGLKAAVPLGFNNSYALALREADAQRLGVATLSAVAALPAATAARLRPGLSHEFLVRADGWPGLQQRYGLQPAAPRALDHGLAYQALAQGQVDLIDVYSTDAQIGRLGLRVLRDDLGFFPRYDAVLLMRANLPAAALAALAPLQGHIDEAAMIAMNAAVEIDGRPFAEVAGAFLRTGPAAAPAAPGLLALIFAPDLGRLLGQHLALVAGSVLMAVGLGVPLGVLAQRRARLGAWVMAAVGLLQTLPSLALLAFLIAWLGRIGFLPALLALFLYALLPIVRNTVAGLASVPAGQRDAARALGLRPWAAWRCVELPQALPTLLAGIGTAAVINVGTATVAAFVGAGGLGDRIVAGLAVNDTQRMLAGAIPAALLALAVQAALAGLQRWLVPAPLRGAPQRPGAA